MGVKVERLTYGLSEEDTTIDDYPTATSFWYDPADEVMYVQLDNVTVTKYGRESSEEVNLAAYPKDRYIRCWLDPAPEAKIKGNDKEVGVGE
jgi:hypothetical protein